MGTFHERIEELRDRTGCRESHMRGTVMVDQIYAHYQHERLDLKHPRGGHARFLTAPLFEHHRSYLRDIARTFLEDGGRRAMVDAVEHLAGYTGGVGWHAPVELGDLRASGHPFIWHGGRVIYDRPPHMHRLTKPELAAKSRARSAWRRMAGLPTFFMQHGKIHVIPGTSEVVNVVGRRP
jgi:hypothetical protein